MSMKLWIGSNAKAHSKWPWPLAWVGRALYYYLILMALFVLYFVLKQHTPPPFIYSNF